MQIRTNDGQVMYESEFRTHIKSSGGPSWDTTTTEVLESLGADVVFEGPQAQPTRYQTAYRDGVEQIEGKWYSKYILGPVFIGDTAVADEAAYKAMKDAEQAKAVRQTRNDKLAETDWRYRRDQTTTPAWDAYCQALRDVPTQAGFPWTIVWPTQPE